MSPAKKPAKKTAARSKSTAKAAARKPTAKATPKKTAAKKSTAKKATAAKKTTAKKTAASKKTTAKKTPARKKTTAKKPATPKRTAAKKTAAKKTVAPKKSMAKKTSGRGGTKTTAAPKKTTGGKSPAPKAPVRPAGRTSAPPARAPRPAKLDAKQLAAIRGRLLEERAQLVRQQNELDAEGTQGESLGEAGLDDDFADAGTATFDRERDLSIRNNITDLIDQITRAVSRIDEGTYGTCERCGRPIDAARLKALPHALLCLDCKRREERGR